MNSLNDDISKQTRTLARHYNKARDILAFGEIFNGTSFFCTLLTKGTAFLSKQ